MPNKRVRTAPNAPPNSLASVEATPQIEDVLVSRCYEMLLDDFYRQSRYLHVDDITRVSSRLQLSFPQVLTVWARLSSQGVTPDGIDQQEQGQASNNSKHHPNQGYPACYVSHQLLNHHDEILLARRLRAGTDGSEATNGTEMPDSYREIVRSAQAAKAKLILSNIRLVVSCAKKLEVNTSIPLDDLIQEGILGLFRAVSKYDPERGFRFATYATWWINQTITRAIETTDRQIRVPVNQLNRLRVLRIRRSKLMARLRRHPSPAEIASETGFELSEVMLLLQIECDTQSLDAAPLDGEKPLQRTKLQSKIESPVAQVERLELLDYIRNALRTLDKRSRFVLVLRFGLDGLKPRTLDQVGTQLGVTRERVRQLEKRALKRISSGRFAPILRQYLDTDCQT
jgi:RNA polymerase primary sigma factor